MAYEDWNIPFYPYFSQLIYMGVEEIPGKNLKQCQCLIFRYMYTGEIKRHDRIQIHGAMVTWGINHIEKEDKLDSHQGLRAEWFLVTMLALMCASEIGCISSSPSKRANRE